jgi:hypothetical protein
MKVIAFAVTMLALAGAGATAGAAPAQDANQVSAQGCVEAGTEASCLVVKDMVSAKLYNLLIKGDKPAVGTGIEFTGVRYNGMTVCMQGLPVQVATWTRKDTLKCEKSHRQ